jgi:hypothetical protein
VDCSKTCPSVCYFDTLQSQQIQLAKVTYNKVEIK